MSNKFNITKLVGLFGLALAGVATLVGNWAQEQQLKECVKEEVEKALAEKDENKNREESN